MAVLGTHINNASSQFSNVTSGFMQLGNKIQSAGSLEEEKIQEIKQISKKGGELLNE